MKKELNGNTVVDSGKVTQELSRPYSRWRQHSEHLVHAFHQKRAVVAERLLVLDAGWQPWNKLEINNGRHYRQCCHIHGATEVPPQPLTGHLDTGLPFSAVSQDLHLFSFLD